MRRNDRAASTLPSGHAGSRNEPPTSLPSNKYAASLTQPLGHCGAAEIQQILGRRKHPLLSLRIIGVVGLPFDVVAAALTAVGVAAHCTTEVWASTDDNHIVYLRTVDGVMVPTWTERPFRTIDWGGLDRPVPRLFDSLISTVAQPRTAENHSR